MEGGEGGGGGVLERERGRGDELQQNWINERGGMGVLLMLTESTSRLHKSSSSELR